MQIKLTQGKFSLVSKGDFARINKHKWCISAGYAVRNSTGKPRRLLLMHREILGAPVGAQVDHKNRNKLDNRRCNLRIATSSENIVNSSLRKDNTTGYRGVYWDI